ETASSALPRPKNVRRFISVSVVGIETDLDAQRPGQLALVQAVQGIDTLVQGIQALATAWVGDQLAERLLQRIQFLHHCLIGAVDTRGDFRLIAAEQLAQAVVIGTLPQALRAGDGGLDTDQRGVAAPGLGLVGLWMSLGLAT